MLRDKSALDSFVEEVEPRLRNALIPTLGLDGAREATAEALGYGWEHWARLCVMDNPTGVDPSGIRGARELDRIEHLVL